MEHCTHKSPTNTDKSCNTNSKQTTTSAAQYYCPMHCEGKKTYTKPGSCPICGMELIPKETDKNEENKAYKRLLKKFKIAVIFTLPIFIIAMSDMIPNNPIYKLMGLKAWNWVQFGLSLPVVFYATFMFFERAWQSIKTRHLNMFTLIGIGSGAAWLFSVIALLVPDFIPEQFKSQSGAVHVYFEAATVILTLVLLGQLLEARAHSKTNFAIKKLLELSPQLALKIENGKEKVVPVDEIEHGDLLRVKPGEKVPVDGVIEEGETTINESMLTGEPIPVDKQKDSKVSTGTINGNSTFVMIAKKVGAETMLSQIIEMVKAASHSQAPIQKLADKISAWFVPIVVLIAMITFVVWAIIGPYPAYVFAFINAVAVLIVACPCALGLATPMSVMVGIGAGAKSGILIKKAEVLEAMNTIDTLIVDKTGTLTEGKPSVEKIVCIDGYSEEEIVKNIVALNKNSEHPLAKATIEFAKKYKHSLKVKAVSDFKAVTGKGVMGKLDDAKIALGNEKQMRALDVDIPKALYNQSIKESKQGKTVSYLSIDKAAVGFVVITDRVKKSSKSVVKKLQNAGLEVWMFTGDNRHVAKAISKSLSLDGFKAQMLPLEKQNCIKELQVSGKKVAMAGDGINDAPALAQANLGIAMGTGTDVAIENADVILMKGDLQGIVKAKNLSKKTMQNIRQNLFFALAYNALGIPIAAGVLYPVFGWLLSPMVAALAMSLSSVSVISNALRLKSYYPATT